MNFIFKKCDLIFSSFSYFLEAMGTPAYYYFWSHSDFESLVLSFYKDEEVGPERLNILSAKSELDAWSSAS